jgi:hypothetical protein
MIDLSTPSLNIGGLTIFGDHADPLQWYYCADKPQLELDPNGTPAFKMVKYRGGPATLAPGSASGGAFLNFEVNLRVSPAGLAAASQEIRTQKNLAQDPRLAPIDYSACTTRLVFLEAGTPASGAGAGTAGFVEKPSTETTPSSYGDQQTLFALTLDIVGSTLYEAMITGSTPSSMGVVYDLAFLAVRSPLSVPVTARWDRVNDRLSRLFGGGSGGLRLAAKSEIDVAVEALLADQSIQIAQPAANASNADASKSKAAASDWLKTFIAGKFFKPSLSPPQVVPSAKGATPESAPSAFAMFYVFQGVAQDQLKDLDADLNGGIVEVRLAPQARLSELTTPYASDALITAIDIGDPFFQTLKVDVRAAPDFAAEHIHMVDVTLEYDPTANPPSHVLLSDANQSGQVEFMLDSKLGNTYVYSYEVFFNSDAPQGLGISLKSPAIQSDARMLIVDPRALYTLRKIAVVAMGIRFDRCEKVDVELRYDDQPNGLALGTVITLAQTNQSGDWTIRLADPTKTAFQYRLTYHPASGTPIVGDWINSTSPSVVVGDMPGT